MSLAGIALALCALLAPAAAAAAPTAPAPPEVFRVGFVHNSTFPPYRVSSATGSRTGFEVDLLEEVCARLKAECEVVELASADERLTALEAGDVDLVISSFSVTPEREARVRFVRPFYALADAALFAPPGALDPAPGAWADVAGKRICVEATNYVGPALAAVGAVPVEVKGNDGIVAGVAAGECVAGATDGLGEKMLAAGMERSDLGPLVPAPYAVAASKNATADDFALRISGALVGALTGPGAPLVADEAAAFAEYGAEPPAALAQLSRALTTMDACAAGAGEAAAAASAAPARGAPLAAAAAAAAVVVVLF